MVWMVFVSGDSCAWPVPADTTANRAQHRIVRKKLLIPINFNILGPFKEIGVTLKFTIYGIIGNIRQKLFCL